MHFLYFLCLIVTLQETVYALAGLSGGLLFAMRGLVDLTAILLLAVFVARQTLRGQAVPLSGLRYERIAWLFLGYSIAISLAQVVASTGASLLTNVSEILVLNRFVFLAVALPFIVTTEDKVERLLRFLWYLILLQAAFGLAQALGGARVIGFFAPNDYANLLSGAERSFTSNRDLERRMLIGSMGDFISFGYVMVFGIIFVMSQGRLGQAPDGRHRRHELTAILWLLLFLGLIFLAGSRTIFLAACLFVLAYLLRRVRVMWRVVAVLLLLLALPLGLFLLMQAAAMTEFEYTNFLSLFSPEFISALMNQRLGHVLLYLPVLLGDPVVLVGFSPDRLWAEQYINLTYRDALPYIWRASFYDTLEDVYPVALITYYGLIGSGLFYAAQWRILRGAWADRKSASPLMARVAGLVVLGLIAIHLLSFGNQSLENRGLSFLFWLSVGLYASLCRIEQDRLKG